VKVVASPGPTGTIFTFSPIYDMTHRIPTAADLPEDVATVVNAGRGLVLVASRPLETASRYAGALVGHVVENGGSLATVLVESVDFALDPQTGLAVVMEVSEPDGDYSDTILRTLDRKPAVIAVSPLRSSRTAIAVQHASRVGCIAIAAIEASEMSEAADGIKSLFSIPPADPVAVVLVSPDPDGSPLPSVQGTLGGKALRLLIT
jgi:Tfp pilus assembly ATPase PilU